MATHVDFVLESSTGNEFLLVEAKSTNAPSTEWASRLARNVLADASPQPNRSLLLVLRNNLYLWRHIPTREAELPDYTGRTEDVLQPYLSGVQTSFEDLNALSFELLVKSWLTDLSEGNAPPSVEVWLRETGLEQFENGTLREEQPN
jgi:hypothetical protein